MLTLMDALIFSSAVYIAKRSVPKEECAQFLEAALSWKLRQTREYGTQDIFDIDQSYATQAKCVSKKIISADSSFIRSTTIKAKRRINGLDTYRIDSKRDRNKVSSNIIHFID